MSAQRVEFGQDICISRVIFIGDSRRLFPFINGFLYFLYIIFQSSERRKIEVVLQIDPVERCRIIGKGTQVSVDGDIHGQVQGQLAVMILKVFGTLQVLEDDVQDFMADAVSHLVNRQGKEDEGIEIHDILCSLEIRRRGRTDIEADFFSHLEKEISIEIIFVIEQFQTDFADKFEEFPHKVCW